MKRIKFIFVNEHAWWHKPISETILKLSHSDKDFAVHMAIWFSEVEDEIKERHLENVVFEAVEPNVMFDNDGNKYDDETCKYTFDLEVEDDVYQRAVDAALRLEGMPYGLLSDCLAIAIKDNTAGHRDYTEQLGCNNTAICSEVGSRILHNMFPDFGVQADGTLVDFDTTSPCDAYHLLEDYIAAHPESVNVLSAQEG